MQSTALPLASIKECFKSCSTFLYGTARKKAVARTGWRLAYARAAALNRKLRAVGLTAWLMRGKIH